MKKICIISQHYPHGENMVFSFVDQLVSQFADLDCECHVITPLSIFDRDKTNCDREKVTRKGNKIIIHCPRYIPFPHRSICGFDTYRLTMISFYCAVARAFRHKIKKADSIYSHFLNPSGIAAAKLGRKMHIPAFVACGESSFDSGRFAIELYKKELNEGICGVVAVSEDISKKLIDMNLFNGKPIEVLPNGVDFTEIYPIDRRMARMELGIDQDAFIVAFVGYFIERKGIAELLKAANINKKWNLFLIGKGTLPIEYDNILFQGPVPHNRLNVYLSAADVFVLPTKAEGCCNAIVEALACGLPIISSNLSFNDGILQNEYSFRINPNEITEIYDSVEQLRNNYQLRASMAENALTFGRTLDIGVRAKKILTFMEKNGR